MSESKLILNGEIETGFKVTCLKCGGEDIEIRGYGDGDIDTAWIECKNEDCLYDAEAEYDYYKKR